MKLTEKLRQFLLQHKKSADSFLFFLSCLALALFASNEIAALQPSTQIIEPATWVSAQLMARTSIWICFLAHFAIYGILSGKPMQYAREHFLQILVCLAWFPHNNASLLQDLNLLSVETVQLIGTLANGILVVRHIVQRLASHPAIATGSVFLLVIITASELLMMVEPQTFGNLFDAIWYSVVTTTTIGYGDIVPHTFAGRCIGIVLMLTGISLAGTFIAIVSQSLQKRLGETNEKKELAQMHGRLNELEANNKRLVDALERDNELKAKLLAALEKQNKRNA